MGSREGAAWPTWAVARARDGAPVFAKPADDAAKGSAARWAPTAKAASALVLASTPQALFRAALMTPPLSFKLPCADERRPRALEVAPARDLAALADRTLAYVVDPLMTGEVEQRRSAQAVLDEGGVARLRDALPQGKTARLALEPVADWCELARALTVLCAIEASVFAKGAEDRMALFRRNGLLSRGLPLERGRVAIPFASAATTGASELHRAICPVRPGGRRAFLGSDLLDVVVHGPADGRMAYVPAPAEAFRSEEGARRRAPDRRRPRERRRRGRGLPAARVGGRLLPRQGGFLRVVRQAFLARRRQEPPEVHVVVRREARAALSVDRQGGGPMKAREGGALWAR